MAKARESDASGEFLTVGQAAAMLGVSPWTLRNWDKSGHLKPRRHPVNGYRIYRRDDLSRMVAVARVPRMADPVTPAIDWSEIGDADHVVQFYERDDFLLDSVASYIASSLDAGQAGLAIATSAHRAGIEARLAARGFDLSPTAALIRDGRCMLLDATEALSKFMVNGSPDPVRFARTLSAVIARAASANRKVRAFGEMVAVLWAQGNQKAAIELEQLWNDLARTCCFSLLCAYPIREFSTDGQTTSFSHVCGQHSRVIPAESYMAAGSSQERLRAIMLLQQKASALEAEIQKRVQAETAARRRERELTDFLENAIEGLHKVGPDGFILWANKAELDLLGYQPNEYIGHHIAEFHADPDVIGTILKKLTAGEVLRDQPARLRAKDGTLRYVLISSNVYMEGGKFIYTRCFTRDITQRRFMEVQHDELQHRLAAIVESSDDAIISKTLDGVVRTWNQGAQRMFGYTPEEAIGKPIDQLIIPADRMEEEPKILQRLRNGDRVDHYETIRKAKNGQLINISVTISPIRNETGKIIGASKIARDITAQKQMLADLQKAKEAAEQASHAKDHFLGVLSHELRTPLTPALAELSFLETEESISAEMRRRIKMIRRNVETQARLVDDLLDLTRISRGKLSLHFEAVDVHELLRNCVAMLQAQADAKFIRMSFDLGAKKHHIWSDPGRMQQVFLNLLSNAVKFTPNGGLIALGSSNPQEDQINIQMRDNGEGIEPELLTRIFEPFEQAPQSRRFGGLGLGLSIVHSLVNMHHGSVEARSEGKNRGSTFTVHLGTIAPPVAAIAGRRDSPTTGSYRILLVEDHADTRTVLTRLLKSFGHELTTVATIQEALAAAQANSFDLLISDMGLPDGTGIGLMDALKQKGIRMRAIALSGFGLDEDIERSRSAGFSIHLTKPVNIQVLCEIIQQAMAGQAA